MRKNTGIKIVAIFALVWIILWVVGTWLLIIFGNSYEAPTQELSAEQLQQIIESETK
jgi:uncharacterized iron-regulated membrane protein